MQERKTVILILKLDNNTVKLTGSDITVGQDLYINYARESAVPGGTLEVSGINNKVNDNRYALGADINFYINPAYMDQAGSKTMLTVGGKADISGATVKAGVRNTGDVKKGDKYTHNMNERNSLYAGLAWQHEFKGTANATIRSGDWSASAPAPSVKGDTGVMELGWKVKPKADGNFEMGLGVNGYMGK